MTGVSGLPDVYDFAITSTLGPLSKSCIPELDAIVESEWTVLTASAGGPDELGRVLDLLDAHGLLVSSARITSRVEPAPASTGQAGWCLRWTAVSVTRFEVAGHGRS